MARLRAEPDLAVDFFADDLRRGALFFAVEVARLAFDLAVEAFARAPLAAEAAADGDLADACLALEAMAPAAAATAPVAAAATFGTRDAALRATAGDLLAASSATFLATGVARSATFLATGAARSATRLATCGAFDVAAAKACAALSARSLALLLIGPSFWAASLFTAVCLIDPSPSKG